MKRNKTLSFLFVVMALLLSLVLSACSTDSSTAVSTATSGTNTTVAASGTGSATGQPTTAAVSSVATVQPTTAAAQTVSAPVGASTAPLQPTGNIQTDIKNVVKAVNPGVVLVSVSIQSQDVFGRTSQGQGTGTGSIITADGYIVTNNHVVEDGNQISVTLSDGRNFPAKLIGREPANDIAVIKIEGQNFPTVKIGDSSKVEVGDWVVAIGNALGLRGGSSVTAGIISALHRSVDELTDLIQTDAAINPGNSGGPLLNLNGELIGINTAVATSPVDGGAAQNIGFALSINQVKPLIDGFISGNPVVRPYMGVNLVNVTPVVAGRYGLKVKEGVLISDVAASSPAAKAGFKAGDVIVEMDGKPVTASADLNSILLTKKPGDTVSVKLVAQNGSNRTVQITLGQRPATSP